MEDGEANDRSKHASMQSSGKAPQHILRSEASARSVMTIDKEEERGESSTEDKQNTNKGLLAAQILGCAHAEHAKKVRSAKEKTNQIANTNSKVSPPDLIVGRFGDCNLL